MKRNFLFFVIIIVAVKLFKACQPDTWYRTESGLVYKIFPSNTKDSIARLGRTIKVNYIQKAGDTVIESTYNSMPYYELIMPMMGNPYNPSATFPGLKKGDSVVVKQRVDSMMKKKIFEKLPPYLKPTDEWITTVKVLDVFMNDSMLQADKQKETENYVHRLQNAAEQKLQEYAKQNRVQLAKVKDRMYMQAGSNGTGEVIKQGNWISVHFLVRSLQGKILNNSRDTAMTKGPVGFTIGSGFFPPDVESVLINKSKGSTINIYMPAVDLMGLNTPRDMRKDEVIVMQIEILDIKDKAPVK